MAPGLKVESTTDGDRVVVVLAGELSLAEAPTVERRLDEVLAGTSAPVLVDLAAVEFIDSTGLSVLVRAQQRANERGIELGVVNPTPQANRLLSLTGLTERLTRGNPTGPTRPGPVERGAPGPEQAA